MTKKAWFPVARASLPSAAPPRQRGARRRTAPVADDPGSAMLPGVDPLAPGVASPRTIEASFLATGMGSLAGAVGEGWRAGCIFVAFLLLCGLLGTGWYMALHAIMTQLYYAPLCQQVGGPSRQFVAYQIGLPRTMARSSPSSPSRCQFADGAVEIRDAAHPEFREREGAQWVTLGLGFLGIVAGIIAGPALVGALVDRARPVERRRRSVQPPAPR